MYDTADEIKGIELRRLGELEKQYALTGPRTEPAILIEIADLRSKYNLTSPRYVRAPGARDQRLDYDFLMDTVAAALRRVTMIEADNAKRRPRQIALNIWLGAITALVLFAIIQNILLSSRLFGAH